MLLQMSIELPRGSRGVVIGVVIAIIEAIMDVRLPKILLPLLVLQVVRTAAIACPSAPVSVHICIDVLLRSAVFFCRLKMPPTP